MGFRLLYRFFFFLFLVITHRYGKDGRDTKKYEDKCLLFDLDFFQQLSTPQFYANYRNGLDTFVELLNKNQKTGNIVFIVNIILFNGDHVLTLYFFSLRLF